MGATLGTGYPEWHPLLLIPVGQHTLASWAWSRENLTLIKGAYQPAHSRSLISAVAIRYRARMISLTRHTQKFNNQL